MSLGKTVLMFFTFGVGIIGGQILIRKLIGGGNRHDQYSQPPQRQFNNNSQQNAQSSKPNGIILCII